MYMQLMVFQIEVHRAEPLVPGPSAVEVEMAIGKQKDTNNEVLIRFQQNWLKQQVGQLGLRSLNLLILFEIRRNCWRSGRSKSLYPFLRRLIKQISNCQGLLLLSTTYKVLSNISLSRLTPYAEEIIGDHQCGI
jgi:hypothetical protein